MLSLSTLYTTLYHILSPPSLHTAILFTASGQLISYASNLGSQSIRSRDSLDPDANGSVSSDHGDPCPRPKDDIRVLIGLGSELWGETKDDGIGMVDCELGRLVVIPVMPPQSNSPRVIPESPTISKAPTKDTDRGASAQPLMLIALNGTDEVPWDEMRAKAQGLASHFSPPLVKYREYLTITPFPPPSTTAPPSLVTSPAPGR